MFANVEFHPRMERQNNKLTRCIAGKSNAARTGGNTDNKRHPSEDTLGTSLQGHNAHCRRVVLPKQNVMLKKYRIVLSEIDLSNGHDLESAGGISGSDGDDEWMGSN